MGEPRESVDDAVIRQATDWFSLLQLGGATEADRQRFEEWRKADPRHAAAYEQMLGIWDDVGELDDLRDLATDPDFGRPARNSLDGLLSNIGRLISPQRLTYAGFAFAILAIAAIATLQPAWLLPNIYETRTAETKQINAPDGSVIDLGPESRIKIAYSDTERRIYLTTGEAFFDVRNEDNRAFIVSAEGAEIQVTGTKFNVHSGPSGVTVSVAEGAVELRRNFELKESPTSDSDTLQLAAGQQAVAPIDEHGLSDVIGATPSKVGSWRTGHLHYTNAKLRDVIADANRYSRVPIIVADDNLLDLKLVAAFRTEQIDPMINGLPEILPLEVDRSKSGKIILRAVPKSDG